VNILLNDIETRVLGALIEKEITTPEYYPLSLNALLNACNQKSNREPVMTLDEDAVRQALRSLSDQTLARSAGGDSRVAKYEHRLNETFNFHRHEIAILCVLLLRGPQTPGELRTRTERMYHFEDLDTVQSALQLLMKRDPPLVKILPRQPGTKEARYTQLLSADAHADSADSHSRAAQIHAHDADLPSHSTPSNLSNSATAERLEALEAEVASLKNDVSDLKDQLARFRKQFE
jgi:uncharacterized protein YceH (UPF0502 family)